MPWSPTGVPERPVERRWGWWWRWLLQREGKTKKSETEPHQTPRIVVFGEQAAPRRGRLEGWGLRQGVPTT